MKTALLMFALACSAPSGAQESARSYDMQARVLDGSTLLATPHLLAAAGQAATMSAEDAQHHGWRLTMTATPTGTPRRASVDFNAERWSDGVRIGLQVRLVIDSDKPAVLIVPGNRHVPETRFEVSVRAA